MTEYETKSIALLERIATAVEGRGAPAPRSTPAPASGGGLTLPNYGRSKGAPVVGASLHWLMARFAVTPFNSLLLTFGLMGIVEAVIQAVWTADFKKLESAYSSAKFKVGFLYVPIPELITLLLSVGLSIAIWAVLRYTDLGRALRAAAEDPAIASAFGINEKKNALVLAGTCSALASVAGVCLALSFSLAPSQMYAWIGVVFAAVMLGGLGRALAPLLAGTLIGVSEAVTMAVTAPSWAPIVSFTLLILVLVLRPGRAT